MTEVKEVNFINDSNAYLLKTQQLKDRLQWACDECSKHQRGSENHNYHNGYARAMHDIIYSSVFDRKLLSIKEFEQQKID